MVGNNDIAQSTADALDGRGRVGNRNAENPPLTTCSVQNAVACSRSSIRQPDKHPGRHFQISLIPFRNQHWIRESTVSIAAMLWHGTREAGTPSMNMSDRIFFLQSLTDRGRLCLLGTFRL